MNADEILFRSSSLGHIMTEPRTKSETLSESCKTHLVDIFVSKKYGRNTDISNRYTTKGLMVEEDSLTLYSRYKGIYFKKNELNYKNEFISGTPDIVDDLVRDVKSSWDIYTFFRNTTKKLNSLYYWQIQGYLDLTGKQSATLAYCLINTPETLIYDEKRKLLWKMGVLSEDNPMYQEACLEIDRLSIYDDIPLQEKVIEISIERNQSDIDSMHNRVIECRYYMNTSLFKIK